MSWLDKDFRYTNAAGTAKPGYLARKWDRMYPGWRKAKKPEPPIAFPHRQAA